MSLSQFTPAAPDPELQRLQRERLASLLETVLPGADSSHGTVVGDFILSPMAAEASVAEETYARLRSDFQLAEPARGNIFSCEFVEEHLRKFGLYDMSLSPPRGKVRLLFSADEGVTFGREIVFRFGSTDWYATINSAVSSSVSVVESTSIPDGAPDTYMLRQVAPQLWAADVNVDGVAFSAVKNNDAASINVLLPNLVAAQAACDFVDGIGARSLSALAAKAPHIFFSPSLASRGHAISFMLRNFSATSLVFPVVNGDPEESSSSSGPWFALPSPKLDIYYRSHLDQSAHTDSVQLAYVNTANGKRFRGRLSLPNRPSEVLSVKWAGSAAHTGSFNVLSLDTDGIGENHFGSSSEEFWIDVVPVLDALGLPTVSLTSDILGDTAWFEITYTCDPLIDPARRKVENPDNTPPVTRVSLREARLAEVSAFFTYVRDTPAHVDIEALTSALRSYFLTTGGPTNALSLSKIHRIMQNYGARVVASDFETVTRLTAAAAMFVPTYSPDLLDDWGAGVNVSSIPVGFSTGFDGIFPSGNVVEHAHGYAAMSKRITKAVLKEVTLQEASGATA